MVWNKLNKGECPNCGHPLKKKESNLKCTYCAFVIEQNRARRIAESRKEQLPTNHVRLRWQNLKDERCPVDGELLAPREGRFMVMHCIKPECTFNIRVDRMNQILKDPSHPANKFYRPYLHY